MLSMNHLMTYFYQIKHMCSTFWTIILTRNPSTCLLKNINLDTHKDTISFVKKDSAGMFSPSSCNLFVFNEWHTALMHSLRKKNNWHVWCTLYKSKKYTVNASCERDVRSLYLVLNVMSSFQQYFGPEGSNLAREKMCIEIPRNRTGECSQLI